mmetsp:Transcript_23958/g.37012  ORF Transcript_23958/g.37012 Transcript_23958/m.37012 type:complete len:515 (+) Transcript_23958:64-1608(+)
MPTARKDTTIRFLWFPTASVAGNIGLAAALSNFFHRDRDSNDTTDWQAIGASMSSMLASTSIGIVTLTFSLTILSIQIASQTYSPRLLDDFLRDPISQVAVSVNLGSYAYAFCLQYWLFDKEDTEDGVPFLAIHMLSVHMVLVLINFVVFIHYFINGFRLESILHRATESSWIAAQRLEAMNQRGQSDKNTNQDLPEVPPSAYKVLADHSGYLASYKLDAVIPSAKELDICIRFHPNIGEFIAEGSLLAYVWDAKADIANLVDDSESLRHRILKKLSTTKNNGSTDDHDARVEEKLGKIIASGLDITTARTGELDVLLGVQQLTDVAVRALSAAVNDPMTAIQALDYLSSLFGRLAPLDFPIGCATDSRGVIRCFSPRRSFAYLLSILDSIRFYGGADLQVTYRLIRFYGDLGASLKRHNKKERLAAILAQIEQCMSACRKNFDDKSLEMQSIQELYDYVMALIATSDKPVLLQNEAIEKDLNALETTYAQPTKSFFRSLPDVIQGSERSSTSK